MKKLLLFPFMAIHLFAMYCTEFAEFKEFNGHYYTVTASKQEFLVAKAAAENNGGYLAIPNSAGENDFLRDQFAKKSTVVWIGVYDPNYIQNFCVEGDPCVYDRTRFKTVKGGALGYSNWHTQQPDNKVKLIDISDIEDLYNGAAEIGQDIKIQPLGEHWVAMSQNGYWMDEGNHYDEYNNPVKYKAVLEFNSKPECAYENLPDPTLNPNQKKCTSKVYGANMDNTHMDGEGQFINGGTTGYTSNFGGSGVLLEDGVISSQIFNCQKDIYGTYYCPDGLAQCSNSWDYDPGYSVPHTGTRYTSKICPSGWSDNGGNCKKGGTYPAAESKSCPKLALDWGWGGACIFDKSTPGEPVKILAAYPSTYIWRCLYTVQAVGNDEDDYCPHEIGDKVRSGIEPDTTYSCPSGGTLSGSTCNTIEYTAKICPSGFSSNSATDCYQNYTYYTYHCRKAEDNFYDEDWRNPANPGGDCGAPNCNSSVPASNNCKRLGFKCQSSPDRPCAWVNGGWKCSPYPCFGESNLDSSDTVAGANDKENQGFEEDGQCTGSLYIFNGGDKRCRSKDALFGAFGGGCCQKENGGGTLSFFATCKEDEKMLAKYRKETEDLTVYIGDYCSKELDLVFTKICIQTKETYCKFNSKLARIIHEQGRPQISMGWGSAKFPNCRGFTPEELQKLDFSKMDLSEFIDDVVDNINADMIDPVQIQQTTEHIGDAIQQKAEQFLQGVGN